MSKKELHKTDHLNTCRRFWLTTLLSSISIGWGGQVAPAKTGQGKRFFQIIPNHLHLFAIFAYLERVLHLIWMDKTEIIKLKSEFLVQLSWQWNASTVSIRVNYKYNHHFQPGSLRPERLSSCILRCSRQHMRRHAFHRLKCLKWNYVFLEFLLG